MKKILLLFLSISLLSALNAQEIPGTAGIIEDAPLQQTFKELPAQGITKMKVSNLNDEFLYSTTTYSFQDIILFSYFDESVFYMYFGDTPIDTIYLDKDEYYQYNGSSGGIYTVESNNSFTILIGDAVTNKVMGYFAVDESGKPVSTHLNTYMPKSYQSYREYFIVFAYHDNTEFTLLDLSTNTVIATGLLDKGEHYELNGHNDKFIGVRSGKPVSALSYTDQGYFVPSTNGTFSGTEFFGFSGYVGSWPNGIVVTAYNNDTEYFIINSETNDTIEHDTLNMGEANDLSVRADTYWRVVTNKLVTVANIPYAYYSSSYAYLTRQIDETGTGLGTNFYAPVLSGDLNIVSHDDNNTLTVIKQITNDTLVKDSVLNKGDSYYLYSSKGVHHITGTGNLSVISATIGSHGADFVPLSFSLGLADLAISSGDINTIPDTIKNPGDPIIIEATVHNYGYVDAENVEVFFFDGNPKGGMLIDYKIIPLLKAGESQNVAVSWTAPDNIKYHAVYVSVDEHDKINESNSSNNIASKFLIPNDDLLPPLTAYVAAPTYIDYTDEVLAMDSFRIRLTLFNTGDVAAEGVYAKIMLPNGLNYTATPENQVDSIYLGMIVKSGSVDTSWYVHISEVPQNHTFYYSILVDAENAESKVIERMIVIGTPISSIQENESTNYKVYPNPFTGYFSVELELNKPGYVNVELYDISGKKLHEVYNAEVFGTTLQTGFDGSSLPNGVYFMSVQSGTTSKVIKVVKK